MIQNFSGKAFNRVIKCLSSSLQQDLVDAENLEAFGEGPV